MDFKVKYKLMLWKSYVDRGRGVTSYFNELFLIFGTWAVFNHGTPLVLASIFLAYLIMTFVIGMLYFKYGWQEAEAEVQNQYNLFQKQMRKTLNITPTLE